MTPEEIDRLARKVYIACVESGRIHMPGEEYKMGVIKSALSSAEEEGAARSRPQIDGLLALLRWAGPAACSMLCPSTGKEGTPIPHLPECERLRAAVEAGETRDILRDAVRKYKAEESKP